jgi:DNA-binding transcriptional regulator YdaS (Cro superfamily)
MTQDHIEHVEHIERAIAIAGSQAKLAAGIGVKQQTISNWLKGAPIKAEHCSAIERFTQGNVTRTQLRPSNWQEVWPELAAAV